MAGHTFSHDTEADETDGFFFFWQNIHLPFRDKKNHMTGFVM